MGSTPVTVTLAPDIMWEFIGFLVAQAIVIATVIVSVHVRTQKSIGILDTQFKSVHTATTKLEEQHTTLSQKVDGISRNLARMEGKVEAEFAHLRTRKYTEGLKPPQSTGG